MRENKELSEWYEREAIPRLARMDELAPRCAFDKWPAEMNEDERKARKEWDRLMKEQIDAEVEAGL